MTSDVEVRLVDAPEISGQIRLASLAPLASALQDVYERLGRTVGRLEGSGRTPDVLHDLTRLTLVDLRHGSTGLALRRGDDTALDVEPPEAREVDERFEELVHAMAAGVRPDWASVSLADSTVGLIDALRAAAPTVVITPSEGSAVTLVTANLVAEPWKEGTLHEAEEIVVFGRLEAVDLEKARFRIRDDIGNHIALTSVLDPEATAPLVTRRVRAAGTAARRADGALREVRRPVLVEHLLPTAWTDSPSTDLAALLDGASGPDTSEPLDLSDEEFDAFLRATGA